MKARNFIAGTNTKYFMNVYSYVEAILMRFKRPLS